MSDGASIYECRSADEVVDLVRGGQGVFGIAVGSVWREVEGTLGDAAGRGAWRRGRGARQLGDELARSRRDAKPAAQSPAMQPANAVRSGLRASMTPLTDPERESPGPPGAEGAISPTTSQAAGPLGEGTSGKRDRPGRSLPTVKVDRPRAIGEALRSRLAWATEGEWRSRPWPLTLCCPGLARGARTVEVSRDINRIPRPSHRTRCRRAGPHARPCSATPTSSRSQPRSCPR